MSNNIKKEIVEYKITRDKDKHKVKYWVKFRDGTTAEYTEGGLILSAARYPIWLDYIKDLEDIEKSKTEIAEQPEDDE